MKRDRGIDFARTKHRHGVGFGRCQVCRAAWNDGQPEGCTCINAEQVFADQWEKENEDNASYSGTLTTLFITRDRLDLDQPDPQLLLFEHEPQLTPRERVVAATVIQWLATTCGWSFLTTALKRCGYLLVNQNDYEGMRTRATEAENARRAAESERTASETRLRSRATVAFGRFETLEEDDDQ